MNRRRTTTLALAVAAASTLGAIALPSAGAAPAKSADDVTTSEWACLALGEIDLGLCLDDPLPDLRALPTLPEIIEDVLELLG